MVLVVEFVLMPWRAPHFHPLVLVVELGANFSSFRGAGGGSCPHGMVGQELSGLVVLVVNVSRPPECPILSCPKRLASKLYAFYRRTGTLGTCFPVSWLVKPSPLCGTQAWPAGPVDFVVGHTPPVLLHSAHVSRKPMAMGDGGLLLSGQTREVLKRAGPHPQGVGASLCD